MFGPSIGGRPYVLLNQTLPASWIRGAASDQRSKTDADLVENLRRRNASTLQLPDEVIATVGLPVVDIKSIRKTSARTDTAQEFDYDAIWRQFGQRGVRVLRISLPAFSEDG